MSAFIKINKIGDKSVMETKGFVRRSDWLLKIEQIKKHKLILPLLKYTLSQILFYKYGLKIIIFVLFLEQSIEKKVFNNLHKQSTNKWIRKLLII